MSEKEPVKLTARLEVIEEPKAVLDPVREPEVEMTAEEIAVAEREKAQLLAELLAKAAAKRTERPPAEPVSVSEPIFIPPTPELQAMAADVNEIDAEIEALEQQNAAMVKARAEAVAADEATHKARVAALNEKRNAAAAEAKRLREIAAGAELAARAEQAKALAAREYEREQGSIAEKTAALVERMRPVVDRARAVEAELKQIAEQHKPTLSMLAMQTWRDIPAEWVGPLWAEYSDKVIGAADKRLRELRTMLDGLKLNIAVAEKLMARGWSDDQSQRQDVNEVLRDLGYCVDYVRAVREGLTELNDRLSSIHERGEHIAPQAQRPEVKILITAEEREQVMFDMQMKAQMRGQQSRANV